MLSESKRIPKEEEGAEIFDMVILVKVLLLPLRLIPEEDLKKIAISKEQSKLGLTSKSKDVF